MVTKNGFKKINIKNCTCYYFDDIMEVEDIYSDIYWKKNHTKIF